MKNKILFTTIIAPILFLNSNVKAAEYEIDTDGAHAFVNFKISHLGYSWLHGRFNDFSGTFYFDPENKEKSKVNVKINTKSIDSNHSERDKHLRNEDFLNTDKFPEAFYVGSYYEVLTDNTGVIHGDFTLNGITKHLPIQVEEIGLGQDPWGNSRAGFEGTTEIKLKDFGINYDLGQASEKVYLTFSIEGIKK